MCLTTADIEVHVCCSSSKIPLPYSVQYYTVAGTTTQATKIGLPYDLGVKVLPLLILLTAGIPTPAWKSFK